MASNYPMGNTKDETNSCTITPTRNSWCALWTNVPAAATRTAPGETLIRNATLLTITHGTLENSDILLRSGKIAAIGKGLKAAANARVIDATGKYVMPGIIDCHSHSMLDTINEGTLAVTSMVRTSDVLNPTDIDLYRELAGGVTTLNLLHGSANAIGGLNTVVKIKYGRPVAEFLFPGAMPGIKFALGENPEAVEFHPPVRPNATLSDDAHGRRRNDSRCIYARARLQECPGTNIARRVARARKT